MMLLLGALVIGVAIWVFWPSAKPVQIATARLAPAERVLAVNGLIRPRLQIDVRPPLGGEIILLPFDVGDRVTKDEVIARIDDAPESAQISQAQAAVRTQQARITQAQQDLARFEALGEFATRRDVEQRRNTLAEARSELDRLRASVTQTLETRARRVIKAPFSAVVLERPVDIGQTVGVDSVIYRVADLANPQVTAEIDEIYAVEVREGMQAVVNIPGYGAKMMARVLHIEPRVNPATGARNVRFVLDQPLAEAPSGLTVTINLIIEKLASAISVPRSSILQTDGRAVMRLVGDDGRVIERVVRFVDWPAETVVVLQGLKAGERYLLNPLQADVNSEVRAAR